MHDGTEVLIAWLSPLGEVRNKRPTGAPLPFRTVSRIGGPADDITDHGLYSVTSWADTEAKAQAEGKTTHRRIMLLGSHFSGQQSVTISTGQVFVDDVIVIEEPVTMRWTESIWRAVGTCQCDIRIWQ